MSKKEVVENRQYTDEFKVEAARLGESIGGNQAAKRLGIPESSLWNWIRLSRAGKLKVNRPGIPGGSILERIGVYEHIEEVFTRGSGAGGAAGVRAPRRTRLAVGGDRFDCREDRLHQR